MTAEENWELRRARHRHLRWMAIERLRRESDAAHARFDVNRSYEGLLSAIGAAMSRCERAMATFDRWLLRGR